MTTSLVNGFVLGIWTDDTEAWIATADGLSRGILAKGPGVTPASNP